MHSMTTPLIDFTADQNTEGGHHGLLRVMFPFAACRRDESRWYRKDAIIPDEAASQSKRLCLTKKMRKATLMIPKQKLLLP